MNEHIKDPKVNWNTIFNYLDEALKIIPSDKPSIKRETRELLELLEPYKDTVLTVYTGF